MSKKPNSGESLVSRLAQLAGNGRKLSLASMHKMLDKLLFDVSTYGIALFLLVFSIVATFEWQPAFVRMVPTPIEVHAFEADRDLSVAEAQQQLLGTEPMYHIDTRLSEAPFWFSFNLGAFSGNQSSILEFPSRHASEITCWSHNGVLLGSANRRSTTGALMAAKSGFALRLDPATDHQNAICRASFVGPARLSVLRWPDASLQLPAQAFFHDAGLLEGGVLTLAAFMLITALVNRKARYVLFSVWLVLGLRTAALSAGWDTQWLGHAIDPAWLPRIRLMTLTSYYMVTITFFHAQFHDDLASIGSMGWLRYLQWSTLPIVAMSLVVAPGDFLRVLWLAVAILIAIMVYLLGRLLHRKQSRVAIWYSASLSVWMFSMLFEVIGAALGMRNLVGSVNSVTASLASVLLAALAVAEQMRTDNIGKMEARAELEHNYEAMPIGLFSLDMEGHFINANPVLRAQLGEDVTSAGRNHWDHYFETGSWDRLHQQLMTHKDSELEIRTQYELKHFVVKAAHSRGQIEGFLQDVTEKRKVTKELLFMADHDPLTKVSNRRGVEKLLGSALISISEEQPLSLAYLDLDRFKLINDLYGHAAGDEVLRQVCARIRAMLGSGQHVGRVGGDEFVITMPNTPIPTAAVICREIVDHIGTLPYQVGDNAFQVRASIGLIDVRHGTKIKDAVSTADHACREAKSGHHDGLVVYEKSAKVFREHEAELALVERIADGSVLQDLFLAMQPIMSLSTPHASLNFEVLLRCRDLEGGMVSAGRIIGAAESSGRVGVIDRWVLATTLTWIAANKASLQNTGFVCMNLSGASLNDERFVQDAFTMLKANPQAARMLCLEVTESVALHDMAHTCRFINEVRSFGVKVALDDFGAGYTSFSYLKDLPADILKIDGSFIVNMNAHPANSAIVGAIVQLARTLGMKTIAEWAEDSATVRALAALGVDYVQGYAVAKPQSPDDILAAQSCASFIKDADVADFAGTRPAELIA